MAVGGVGGWGVGGGFFFFKDTATTEIYTLSLHDALPIWLVDIVVQLKRSNGVFRVTEVWYEPDRAKPLAS